MTESGVLVELTVRYGPFRSKSKTVAVPISARLTDELMERTELSNAPLSLLLAGGKDSALTVRRRVFQMRHEAAREIAEKMVPQLMKAFGVYDESDGYSVEEIGK